MSKTATIYHRDGRERTLEVNEASRLVGTGAIGADKDWSFHKPPPLGWQYETPKYRTTRAVHPSPNSRFKFEPPLAQIMNSSEWQFAERAYRAGETVITKEWPHPSFRPLNFAAQQTLSFFNSRMKSRLPRSPWLGDRIRLDDGLTGTIVVEPTPPQLRRMDQRPAS